MLLPVGDVLSGAGAVLRGLGGAAVWLLNHGLLVALATGAAAYIAWQGHQREERRLDERQKAADGKIAGLAYALQQQLILWSGRSPKSDLERKGFAQFIVEDEARRAEDRALEMLSLAPEASSDVRRAAWNAAMAIQVMLTLYGALSRLAPDPTGEEELTDGERDKLRSDPAILTPEAIFERTMDLREDAIEDLERAMQSRVREVANAEAESGDS